MLLMGEERAHEEGKESGRKGLGVHGAEPPNSSLGGPRPCQGSRDHAVSLHTEAAISAGLRASPGGDERSEVNVGERIEKTLTTDCLMT